MIYINTLIGPELGLRVLNTFSHHTLSNRSPSPLPQKEMSFVDSANLEFKARAGHHSDVLQNRLFFRRYRHIACRNSNSNICLLLLAYEANVEIRNKEGNRPYDNIREKDNGCGRVLRFNSIIRKTASDTEMKVLIK